MTTLDTRKIPAPDDGPPVKRRRGRKVAVLVALLVGLPALALAATYLFGVITGTATVVGTTATVTIESAAQTATTGIDCAGINKGVDAQGRATLNIGAKAYRVTVNGNPPDQSVSLGSCTIDVVVKNATGGAPASVSAVFDPAPTGWHFTAAPATPATIIGGESATITITITADGNVQEIPGGTPFTGKLNIDIPPAGSGSG